MRGKWGSVACSGACSESASLDAMMLLRRACSKPEPTAVVCAVIIRRAGLRGRVVMGNEVKTESQMRRGAIVPREGAVSIIFIILIAKSWSVWRSCP